MAAALAGLAAFAAPAGAVAASGQGGPGNDGSGQPVVRVAKGTKAAEAADADSSRLAGACNITRWGYTGRYMCGSGTAYDIDWTGNGSYDETFVIAPNREIWHIWANAHGWKEMPGNGRGDSFYEFARIGSDRCVAVYAGSSVWANPFVGGKWRGWSRGTCV